MNDNRQTANLIEGRQQQVALWVAGIFAALGFIFLMFWCYNVLLLQKGSADLSDKVLLPVLILMFLAGLGGFLLIRRNRLREGLWLVYLTVLIPPVMAVLILSNIFIIALIYLVTFASISIFWVFPRSLRRAALIAALVALAAMVAIEVWNPAFRLTSNALADFAPYVIAAGVLGLLAFAVRQAWVGNIRTKLIVSFALMAIITLSVVSFFANRSSETNLTEAIGNNLSVVATGQAGQVGQTLTNELDLLNALAMSRAVQQRAADGTAADTLNPDEIQALDKQWLAADAADNNADPLVARVLNDPLSTELLKFRARYPENVEVFLTDLPGVNLATTDRTSDYLQSDEGWWQTAYREGMYIGQPEYDASSKTLASNMAVVVRAPDSDRVVGVLRTTVNINSLGDVLWAGRFGTTGQTGIYLPDGQEVRLVPGSNGVNELIVEKAGIDPKNLLASGGKYQVASINNTPVLISISGVSAPGSSVESRMITDLGWFVGAHQAQSEALLPVTQQTQTNLIIASLMTLLVAMVAFGLAQILAGPIVRLNAAAEKVAAGDLTVQAKVETRDETGTLATTFNKMVSQLNGLVGSLEQRVADRTRALAASTEVSRRISTILDQRQLVKEVVEQVQSAFNYYHVHIYLVDESNRDLVMAGGTGEAGATMLARGHRLPTGKGLVGRAAETNTPVYVPDTSKDSNWLPNPLLPETKSEAAVPIAISGLVLGVLDVQQNMVAGLSEDDVTLLQSIANQVAIAVRNASSYEQSRSQAELESLVNSIGQKIQRAGTVEDVLQTAIREVGVALGASRVSASLQPIRAGTEVNPAGEGNGAGLTR